MASWRKGGKPRIPLQPPHAIKGNQQFEICLEKNNPEG